MVLAMLPSQSQKSCGMVPVDPVGGAGPRDDVEGVRG